MKQLKIIFIAFMALCLFTLNGCGGGGGSSNGSSGSNSPQLAMSSDKAITKFSLSTSPSGNLAHGIITGQNIMVVMPFGTDVTALVATFAAHGTNVSVRNVIQQNSITPNNFSSPVIYTVKANDGSTITYTVTVTVASDSEKSITRFLLRPTSGEALTPGVITGQNITIVMPFGTDVTALVATFVTSGTSVLVKNIPQQTDVTSNDFSNSVTYIVTAADGSVATYTVTVMVAASSAKDITAFSLNGTPGVINDHAINIIMPFGTDVTALIAKFTTTASSVSVGDTPQIRGETINDFTKPVLYLVTAADGSIALYNVTVTIAPSSANTLARFSINGVSGTFNGSDITVMLPWSIDRTKLIATFTTDGASIFTKDGVQVSGITPNNFTQPVLYTVRAADGTPATYTVMVIGPQFSYAYVTSSSHDGSGGTTLLRLDEISGELTPITDYYYPQNPASIVLDPSKQHAYITSYYGGTVVYNVNASDGTLTAPAEVAGGNNMVFNALGNYAYVPNGGTIFMYSVENGQLINPVAVASGDVLAFSKSGAFAYIMNSADNTISMYSVDNSTGQLTALSPATIVTGINPSFIKFSPAGILYVSNSGSDSITQYSVDNSTGQLTLLSTTATSIGLQFIAFNPLYPYAYVLNAGSWSMGYDGIAMYSVSGDVGRLSALNPAMFSNEPYTSSITFSPSGKYVFITTLYGSEEGVDEYSVDTGTGQPTPLTTVWTGYDPTMMVFLN